MSKYHFVTQVEVLEMVSLLFGEETTRNMLIRHIREGQRIGQAFINSIDADSSDRLLGTLYDPFHKDSYKSVWDAIDYLTKGA